MKFLLLLLPAFVHGRIQIQIKTATTEKDASVSAIGSIVDIITDKERGSFNIQDETLKNAVEKYSGGKPQDVFVKSPTPWEDLYLRFGWEQVTRVLYPVKAKIVSIKTEPVIISSEEFINNSTVKIKYLGAVNHEVEDTFINSWTKKADLSVEQEIKYSIGLGAAEIGGQTYLNFLAKWGEGTSSSKIFNIGTLDRLELELEPGQRILTTLNATKSTMNIEIDYAAILKGDIASNYPNKYNGHYFWRYDVNAVLKSANLPTTVASKEAITIEFYSNAQSRVDDLKSKKILESKPVALLI